jgi:acyl dehydratase
MATISSKTTFGRNFDEFEPGSTIEHWPGKTLTSSEAHLFCLLTMNHHPIHLDQQYAKSSHHGKPLVAGTYIFSLVVGLSVRDISGSAIANLGYDEVQHLAPVFEGDTLYASTEILSKRASESKPNWGLVKVKTTAVNQHRVPVLSFKREVLIPRPS